MQKIIYFNQKPLIVLLLISSLILELNAFGHDTESSLGTFMIKSPESTDAPPGDEVQLQCELNLPPEKLEFRFRPQNSSPDERDRLINIHKMVRDQRAFSWSLKCHIHISISPSLVTTSRQKIGFQSFTSLWIKRRLVIIGVWHGLAHQRTRQYQRSCVLRQSL